MTHPIIEAVDLHFSYPDGTRALRGVSFTVQPGEALALVGANGAGKSTLLQHLVGAAFPSRGALHVGGLPVDSGHLPALRKRVGMVFPDPDDQLFMPTVAQDVAFGPRNLGLAPGDVEARVRAALETVDALALAGKPPYRLSSGEKRRVAIATALALEPEILVMDEPTSGLDPRSRRHLAELLKAFGHTMVIATHDLDLVLDLCPRTLVIHEGVLAADGPTRDIFRNEGLLATCHLEKPLSMQGCPFCGPS
ncbi:energy-coupling factor ABC transporter ATP-binding protein [Mesoterricola silvestris]|uniref:ABC transporter ATP-binding protein n=1 Tax=Mesoterricola silvestris TaxID=2927979 RepID=A0AA48KC44_9BACT|nr:ABC transporter ATP-binding protein [Mesoterricola silvestris]BDU73118.1 putative ABC transporter ATP-binding protein [Mesoterricola silvestris]